MRVHACMRRFRYHPDLTASVDRALPALNAPTDGGLARAPRGGSRAMQGPGPGPATTSAADLPPLDTQLRCVIRRQHPSAS